MEALRALSLLPFVPADRNTTTAAGSSKSSDSKRSGRTTATPDFAMATRSLSCRGSTTGVRRELHGPPQRAGSRRLVAGGLGASGWTRSSRHSASRPRRLPLGPGGELHRPRRRVLARRDSLTADTRLTLYPTYWILYPLWERYRRRPERAHRRARARMRAAHGLSLERGRQERREPSMISLIERGESSPTAVVLEKLAAGLGVMLASLFDAPAPRQRRRAARWRGVRTSRSGGIRPRATFGATSRRRACRSRCDRRGALPAGWARGLRNRRARRARAPAGWVLEGAIDITLGADAIACAKAMPGHAARPPTMFHNPTRKLARYAVVIASDTIETMSTPSGLCAPARAR